MGWHVVLASAADGRRYGEVELGTGRVFRKTLNQPTSITWTVPRDYHLAPQMLNGIKTLAQVVQDDHGDPAVPTRYKLHHQGPITAAEKVVGEDGRGTLAVTGASPFWTLGKRLIGKAAAGVTYGTAVAMMDRSAIGAQVVNDVWFTGIEVGTVETTVPTYSGPHYYRPASEVLSELAAPLDGFDFRLNYVAPIKRWAYGATWLKLANLDILARVGVDRPRTVFEFGAGRFNVKAFRQVTDFDQMVNDLTDLPAGFPQQGDTQIGPVLSKADTVSQAEWGLLESATSFGLEVQEYRQKLLEENVAVRGHPRQVITFELPAEHPRDPTDPDGVLRFGVDYDVGDVVRFRATEKFEVRDGTGGRVTGYSEVTTVDALFRIYGVECTIDDSGGMSPTITVVES